jgi:hypothetical protein
MHYVGIHGLSGRFSIAHDSSLVVLATAIAIGTAYGGLRVLLARQSGAPLVASAVAFGLAVSGMHYTAMAGMHFVPLREAAGHHMTGLVASQQILSLVVALCCFVIAAGFLLTLVPDPRRQAAPVSPTGAIPHGPSEMMPSFAPHPSSVSTSRVVPAPLGGLGQPPRPQPALRLPVEAAEGVYFIDAGNVRSIRADAHYTRIHDGTRERMCPWSISEAEAQLDPGCFVRVHRSHIVALPHVSFVRKEGEGAIVELDGPSPHRVPVSRAKIAELKARLGLTKRSAPSH